MRCTDCGLYECCMRTPLGGCPNGEKTEPSRIYTTPNTGHGPWEKGYQPADAMKDLDEKIKKVSESGAWKGVDVDKYLAEIRGYNPTEFDGIRTAALALVDAVERYTMGRCLRSELVNTKENLKNLLNNERD